MTITVNAHEMTSSLESSSVEPGSSFSVKLTLAEERKALLKQIHAQRELLARQLGPVPEAHHGNYPRSMIMRFFTQRPALAASILGKVGALILGARLFKSTGAAVAMASVVQMLAKRR